MLVTVNSSSSDRACLSKVKRCVLVDRGPSSQRADSEQENVEGRREAALKYRLCLQVGTSCSV